MENHKAVRPEHLNHHGFLFGGYLLQWVDEQAWIAASLDYPGHDFVTVGLDKVEFKKSVRQGSILQFVARRTRRGRTSVTYRIRVLRGDHKADHRPIFTTQVTLVCIDKDGHKQLLPGRRG
jgi:acyl-CoA hydrolase